MMHKYLLTLTCQIETPGVLLGLVVAYPCGFLIQMIFFHFWTLWVLSGLWFFKSAWWCFYKEDFPLLPLWFFRYHSSTSSPSGFYSACGFQKVTGEVFRSPPWVLFGLWFSQLYPWRFYSACGFNLAGRSNQSLKLLSSYSHNFLFPFLLDTKKEVTKFSVPVIP